MVFDSWQSILGEDQGSAVCSPVLERPWHLLPCGLPSLDVLLGSCTNTTYVARIRGGRLSVPDSWVRARK